MFQTKSDKIFSPTNLRMNTNKISLILTNKYLLCFEFPVSSDILVEFLEEYTNSAACWNKQKKHGNRGEFSILTDLDHFRPFLD